MMAEDADDSHATPAPAPAPHTTMEEVPLAIPGGGNITSNNNSRGIANADVAVIEAAEAFATLDLTAAAAAAAAAAPNDDNGKDRDDNDDNDHDDDDEDEDAYLLPPNEFLSLLPPSVLPRITHLKSLHDAREALMEQYRTERAALEFKYAAKMEPLYEERRRVVNGHDVKEGAADEGVTEESGAVIATTTTTTSSSSTAPAPAAHEQNNNDDGDDDDDDGDDDVVNGIPQFWVCAMGNVDIIAQMITDADVDCLDLLSDITCTTFPDGRGFELTFHFQTTNNPFFTNTTLTKKYEIPNLLLTDEEPMLKNVTGCTIHWKKNKCLTHKEITRKQRKKGGVAGQVGFRSITKKEKVDSFFHFFDPPKIPKNMDVVDEEEANMIEEEFDHDYDVANAIRCHLIPKAVLFFTGEALEEEGCDDEDDAAVVARGDHDKQGEGGEAPAPTPTFRNGGDGGEPLRFDFGGVNNN